MIVWTVKLIQSFRHAVSGIGWAFKTQRHLKIHAVATVAVIGVGILAQLAAWKWCSLSLCIGLVWMAELFNTALEVLCDRVTREQDDFIKRVKDVSAGAVLITALTSVAIAVIIFYTPN